VWSFNSSSWVSTVYVVFLMYSLTSAVAESSSSSVRGDARAKGEERRESGRGPIAMTRKSTRKEQTDARTQRLAVPATLTSRAFSSKRGESLRNALVYGSGNTVRIHYCVVNVCSTNTKLWQSKMHVFQKSRQFAESFLLSQQFWNVPKCKYCQLGSVFFGLIPAILHKVLRKEKYYFMHTSALGRVFL